MRRPAAAVVAVAALVVPAHAAVTVPRPDPAAVRGGGAPHVYYEVRMPQGRPRGVVLILPGGAWCGATEPADRECGPVEDRIRDDQLDGGYVDPWGGRPLTELQRTVVAAGYVAIGGSYASDEPGLADVVALHDQASERWPSLPVSAWGQSAGGHWAVVLGALRPLAGAVAEAAPVDFAAWDDNEQGAIFVEQFLPSIFGPPGDASPNVDDYDPARLYPPARTPVMLLTSPGMHDQVVPEPVARAFAARVPGTRVEVVAPGELWWVHAQASPADLRVARAKALAFLAAHGGS